MSDEEVCPESEHSQNPPDDATATISSLPSDDESELFSDAGSIEDPMVEQPVDKAHKQEYDEFQLQHLLLAFYSVSIDMERYVKEAGRRKSLGTVLTPDQIIARSERWKNSLDKIYSSQTCRLRNCCVIVPNSTQLKGRRDAAQSLLHCIKQVVALNAKVRVQHMMQKWVIEFMVPEQSTKNQVSFYHFSDPVLMDKREEFWNRYSRTDLYKAFGTSGSGQKPVNQLHSVMHDFVSKFNKKRQKQGQKSGDSKFPMSIPKSMSLPSLKESSYGGSALGKDTARLDGSVGSLKPCGDPMVILDALGLLPKEESDSDNESQNPFGWYSACTVDVSASQTMTESDMRLTDEISWSGIQRKGATKRQTKRTERDLSVIPRCFSQKVMSAQNAVQLPCSWYFRGCHQRGIVPKLMTCLLDSEKGLYRADLNAQSLLDDDIEALCEALKPDTVTTLRLGSNPMKSSVSRLIKGFRSVGGSEITEIDFHNVALDVRAVTEFCKALMNQTFPKLQILNLSGTPFSTSHMIMLATSLRSAYLLKRLHLAGTMLGAATQAPCVEVASMAGELNLQYLDLSHNYFHSAGFEALKSMLGKTSSLTEFHISSNAGGLYDSRMLPSHGPCSGSPILTMFEGLADNNTLISLHLRHTYSDYAADFCLAEALYAHPTLRVLDVSQNPHGCDGIRCLIRLLIKPNRKLNTCNVRGLREQPSGGSAWKFNFSDPNGQYCLDLSNPAERACLRLLCRYADTAKIPYSDAFIGVPPESKPTMDDKPFKNPIPCVLQNTRYVVGLTKGVLQFTFRTQLPSEVDGNSAQYLEDVRRFAKLHAGLVSFVPLVNMYKELVNNGERQIMVMALSYDCAFKPHQVRYFIESSPELSQFIVRNLYSTLRPSEGMKLVDLVPRAYRASVRSVTKNAYFFNTLNPTNHYRLDLKNPSDISVANSLLSLNVWEKAVTEGANMFDTSEYGTRDSFRNCFMSKRYFRFDSTFRLPQAGIFQFDFATLLPPTYDIPTTPFELLTTLLERMKRSPTRLAVKITALRVISHVLCLTCSQIECLMKAFPMRAAESEVHFAEPSPEIDDADSDASSNKSCKTEGMDFRVEIFIMCFAQCRQRRLLMQIPRDLCNQRTCREDGILYNSRILPKAAVVDIRRRLGALNTLDPIHVCDEHSNSGNHFILDLSNYTQRCIATFIICLSAKEEGENLIETSYSEASYVDRVGFAFVVPGSWLPSPPTHGVLGCTYVAQQQNIRLDERQQLAEKYLGW